MKTRDILANDAHWPWPAPARQWAQRQTWHELLFAHWPIEPDVIAARLPSGLTLDTFDGKAWLGVVPFWMSGVHPRGVPSMPWISRFPEINVRTYVTRDGKPGVYFFSLDAGNPVAVSIARRFFYLPYFNAQFSLTHQGDALHYHNTRTHRGAPSATLDMIYRPIAPIALASPSSIAHWLTERYCLYTSDPRGNLYRGEIRHSQWPLREAEASFNVNTMAAAHGFTLPDIPPLLHYAQRLDVVIWPLERLTS